MYITRLSSPVGVLLLASDEIALTGLWMEGHSIQLCCCYKKHRLNINLQPVPFNDTKVVFLRK